MLLPGVLPLWRRLRWRPAFRYRPRSAGRSGDATCGAVVHGGGGHGAGRSVEKLVEVSELDYHQPQALHLFAESIAFAYHGGNAGRERLDLLERQRRC